MKLLTSTIKSQFFKQLLKTTEMIYEKKTLIPKLKTEENIILYKLIEFKKHTKKISPSSKYLLKLVNISI